MTQSYVIGIDIFKSKIDCAVFSSDYQVLIEKEVLNTDGDITAFIKHVLKTFNIAFSELLICCENTGIYNRPLERVCIKMEICLWVEHALKIKRASTDMRGKNDKKDALRIAEYALRYQDKKCCFKNLPKQFRH